MNSTDPRMQEAKMSAALCLYTCRSMGALVLRLWDGHKWYLHIYNGTHLPSELKFQLLELEPFVLMLLRELASNLETSIPI